jgi:hypothetical protein
MGSPPSTANLDDLLRTVVEDIIERLVDKGSMRCPTLLIDQSWMPELTEANQGFVSFESDTRATRSGLVLVVRSTARRSRSPAPEPVVVQPAAGAPMV